MTVVNDVVLEWKTLCYFSS